MALRELADDRTTIDHWLEVARIEPQHPETNQALDAQLSTEEMWSRSPSIAGASSSR